MNNQPKKILDILPPALSSREEKAQLIREKTRLKRKAVTPSVSTEKPKRKLGLGGILILCILFFAAILCYLLLSRSEIEIWPETQALNLLEKVEVNPKENQADFSKRVIPGRIIEIKKELSQEFPASGKILKEEKARGQIRVYNAYSTSPQALITNTRFISAEGKLFRSVERVTIPGAEYDKGKLVSGFLDIQVVAAEPGENYNVGPSTFSIPGFAGTPKYTAFYGKSFSLMAGGFKGEISRVTNEDLEKAKTVLTDKLFEESKKSLNNEVPADFVLVNEAQTQEIAETYSSFQTGAETQSFSLRVKTVLKALIFKKTDLENFVRQLILFQMPQDNIPSTDGFWSGRKIYEEGLKINYEPDSAVNWQTEKMNLKVAINAKVYPGLDEVSLKKGIIGKSLREVQLLLEEYPQTTRVEVKFWPFWVNRVPRNLKQINIKINIDPAP